MLNLGPIKARAEAGWVIHPENCKLLIAEVERLRGIIENHEDCTERDCAALAEFRDVNDLPFCRVCYEGLLADSMDGEL